MADPEPRRRRPAVSCSLCRRRKIRCNRETPCSNCVRSRNQTCVYENQHTQHPRQHLGQSRIIDQGFPESVQNDRAFDTNRGSAVPSHPSSSSAAGSARASTLTSQPSLRDVESLKSQIRHLEQRLSEATSSSAGSPVSSSNIETKSSRIGGTFYLHRESRSSGQPPAVIRGITHKTRLFGQSHWINGVTMFLDMFEMIEPQLREEISKVFSGIQRCKTLGKLIKSRRAPHWPLPPQTDLPPKDIADELVDCYFRTNENIYRILHIPNFRRDYEALWVPEIKPETGFLAQLKLVLAIGAITYDEQFSLRTSAIRWVYEAQTWLSEPSFKSRLGIKALQTNLLLLLAREIVDTGGEPTWISAGSLLRTGVHMGLHRDPAHLPKMTTFAAEMRRRLWNTVLEVNLQSSLTLGVPPLFSLDDFDTAPPSNLDDDQLTANDSVPKPEGEFTQVSIAIAFRRTFSLRLAATKFLNDLGSSGTYEETLRLDAELRASYKAVSQMIRGRNSSTVPSPSRFEIGAIDFLMHRYLSALHVPFFGPALHQTAYAFSRRVVIETSLKIWSLAYPSSSIMTAPSRSGTIPADRNDLARLVTCGSGTYRTTAMQAVLLIAVELRTQLQEEESLGPVPLRVDLLSVLDDAKAWCLRCIEIGETNIKGYMLINAVAAYIEGLMQGLGRYETARLLLEAAEGARERCLPILEEMAAHSCQDERAADDDDDQTALDTRPEEVEDWDYMMSGAFLGQEDTDPISWIFDDDVMQAT